MRTLNMLVASASLFSAARAFSTIGSKVSRAYSASAISMAKEGDMVPSVTFKARVRDPKDTSTNPFKWKDVSSADLFKGKRCVVFSLPGAFTPTCSSTHLPGYEKNYDAIKAMGVDEIYCLSVRLKFIPLATFIPFFYSSQQIYFHVRLTTPLS